MTSYPYLPEQTTFSRRRPASTSGGAAYRPARRIALDMRRRHENHHGPW
jgi:hypothetical protein